MLSLKNQYSILKEELQSHMNKIRTQHQHFQHQFKSLKASSSTVPSTTPSPTISDDTMGKIDEAIRDEFHDRLKKISNQIQAAYKYVDDNSLLTGKI